MVFQPGHDVISVYTPVDEDGLYTRKVVGVISKEEYEDAIHDGTMNRRVEEANI